ncbi:hypothetical protein GOODEAATRI_014519, partial [Goodea atripinnis]
YGEIRLTISVPSPSSRSQPVGPCSGPVIPAVWAKSYYNPLPPSSISTLPRFLVPSPPAPSFRQSVFAAVNGNRGEAEIAYKQWGKSRGTKQEKQEEQEEAGKLFKEIKREKALRLKKKLRIKRRIITGGNLTGNQQQNPTPEENYKGLFF